MKVLSVNVNGNSSKNKRGIQKSSIRVNSRQETNDRFHPTFGNSGTYLNKAKRFAFAGLFGVAVFTPAGIIAQQAAKINPNAVIYKVEDDDLDLEQKLIDTRDSQYKKYVQESDSVYNRASFLKTWNNLPSSSRALYEDVEDQIATDYIKNGTILTADSLGVEKIKRELYEIPNKKKNPVVLSVLESANEAIKNNSSNNAEKEIFNPKLLSPRKYKLFVDINYIIKEHLVFGKNGRLQSSRMPYGAENVKKIEKELKVVFKEADFVDYIYKTSYKNLINKFLRR